MSAGSAGIQINENVTRWAIAFDRKLASDLKSGSGARKALEVIAGNIRKEIADWTSQTEGRKTGALSRSFRPRVKLSTAHDGTTAVFGVFSVLPYAGIHETGGVIRPKKARMLAIPLTSEARRVGSPRAFPRKLFVIDHGSKPALAETLGTKRKRLKVHYVLRSSATIRAKKYLSKANTASTETVVRLIGQAVDTVVTST